MPSMKNFFESILKDKDLKIEFDEEIMKALLSLLEQKGLKDEAVKMLATVTEKFSEAHGFKPSEMEELSEEELEAIAGGGHFLSRILHRILHVRSVLDPVTDDRKIPML